MCAEKLGSLALSFEDHLVCRLLAECSPPAAQAVKDYFLQIIAPHFFSGLFEILVLPAPPGSPQLLVWWISALSVLTLTDEKGGGPWGSLGQPPSHMQKQHLSGVLSCTGGKNLSEGWSLNARLLYPSSLPLSAASSAFREAGEAADGAGSCPRSPYLQLVRMEWECRQPPLTLLCCRREQPGEFE